MPKQKTLEEAYHDCQVDGFFKDQQLVGMDKIKTMLQLSDSMLDVGQNTKKNLDPKSPQWSIVYTLHYDALRELADALVSFYNKKIPNHQCLFAYLCEKHPELEFNWDFFEKIRTKRNGINYYGSPVNGNDWKEVELQTILYIRKLREEIEKKVRI